MKTYILDTNILIKDPTILALWNSTIKVIVPDIVIEELMSVSKRLSGISYIPEMIYEASRKGFLEIVLISNNEYVGVADSNLSQVDQRIALFTKEFSKGKRNVYLVTQDRKLQEYAKGIGLNVLNLAGFQAAIYGTKTVNINQLSKKDNISQYQRKQLFNGFLAGVILTVLSFLIYWNFQWIVSKIRIGWVISFLIVTPFVFYWVRSRFRIGYALAEFIFGFASTYLACQPLVEDFHIADLYQMPFLVPFLAGIYVMVRGVDNFGKGIQGTSLEEPWKRVFKE